MHRDFFRQTEDSHHIHFQKGTHTTRKRRENREDDPQERVLYDTKNEGVSEVALMSAKRRPFSIYIVKTGRIKHAITKKKPPLRIEHGNEHLHHASCLTKDTERILEAKKTLNREIDKCVFGDMDE